MKSGPRPIISAVRAVAFAIGVTSTSFAATPATNAPGPLRLKHESFLAAFGRGCEKQAETNIQNPTLYFVEHGFWKVVRFGQELGESHSLEFSVSEPHRSVNGNDPVPRWGQEHKGIIVHHHDAIFPVYVAGYDVVLKKNAASNGCEAAKSADEKNIFAVLLNQKYATHDEIGVNCWGMTVASATAESAPLDALNGISAGAREKTTVESIFPLDSIQGYAVSLHSNPANVSTQQSIGQLSASLVLRRSSETTPHMTAPKLYAGCFGFTRDGKTGSGGEDQGVLFAAADASPADTNKTPAKAVAAKGVRQWGRKTGFHSHQTQLVEELQDYAEISTIRNYTVALEKTAPVDTGMPCLYAVVVVQKLDGSWAGLDRWIELVAATNETEAGREALNTARAATTGTTAVEICCRLDRVDGYAVVLQAR